MCAVDVDVQEHLFGAIGDDHGTEAADRLCEAGVTLFGVDAAVISLVFDGTNTGTLGASPAPARVCGELRAASVPLARAASAPPPSGPATRTRRRSSQRPRRPDAPPCKAGSVLSCIWSPKRIIWRSQKPKQPACLESGTAAHRLLAPWVEMARGPVSPPCRCGSRWTVDLREQASRSAPRQLRRHCGG